MIPRLLTERIKDRLFTNKVILLIGPRQTGKTTLINSLLDSLDNDYLFLDGDDPVVRDVFEKMNTEKLRSLLGAHTIVFIDEAQRIQNIGLTSKIIHDQFPDKQLIISGSSAFELTSNFFEPLTGRKWSFELFPVSWSEWESHVGFIKAEQDLPNRLIYGFYPDILSHPNDKDELLYELTQSYLYKDILNYSGVRKPWILQKLVKALSYQIGQEVNYKEIGDLLGIDSKTVNTYIDILEQAYVVFRLHPFSKNLRNEIKKSPKIYFYDNGIRNAVIGNTSPAENRNDIGALWENFLMSERIKKIKYSKKYTQSYYWRTKQQQEIDLVEIVNGAISGFEFKWNPNAKVRIPETFKNTYQADVKIISRDNFREFIG